MQAQQHWQLIKFQNDIQVSCRRVEGPCRFEYQAQTIIAAPLSRIRQTLADIGSLPEWMPDCKFARVLPGGGPDTLVLHSIHHAPWHRDLEATYHVTTDQDPAGRWVYSFRQASTPMLPPSNSLSRIPQLEGRWVLESLGAERTKVTFVLRLTVDGPFPRAIADKLIQEIPYNNVWALCKQTESGPARIPRPLAMMAQTQVVHPAEPIRS